ncbi:MAG TPA: response regulator [bacterium]|nr:response regulator [bacterium]
MDKNENQPELNVGKPVAATLLVVDDEENARTILRRVFNEDYNVLAVSSGAEALKMLEQQEVDVVVSDQRMPGMSGVELLTHIFERYPDVVRILTTAHEDLAAAIDAINQGHVHRYLTKPWDIDQLRAVIGDEISRKRLVAANKRLQEEVARANIELRNANEDLQDANAKLAEEISRSDYLRRYADTILQTIPACLMTVDGDLIIRSINKMPPHSDFHRDEMLNHSFGRVPFCSEEARRRIGDAIDKVLETRRAVPLGEIICGSDPEKSRVWEVAVFPLDDPHGKAMALVLIYDQTEDHYMRLALMQSEKMAVIGNLAAGVAHEFNNLVGGILGFAQLAKLTEEMDDYRKTVEVVFEVSERAKKIIGDLLTFSRRPPNQIEHITIEEMVDQVITLVERRFDKQQIKIVREIEPEIAIEFDVGQLQQVVLQLLMSARESMPKSGTIVIRSFMDADDCAVIEVVDDGEQIPMSLVEHLFEPFYSFSGPLSFFEGRTKGLGLAVVHSIVMKLNASIQVSNNDAAGVTFRVKLPSAATITV